MREMVVPGETGAVVPAGDGECADGGNRAPISPSPSLAKTEGRQALAHVRQRFPLAREAEGIARVYDRLWSGR